MVSDEPQYRVAMCRMTLNWIRSLPEADEVVARVDPGSIRGVIEARGKTPLIDVDDSRLATEGRMAFDVGWSD